MTITEHEYEEIDSRIQAQIKAALDKYASVNDTENVLTDARLSLIEERLTETRVELAGLRRDLFGEVGSLRSELTGEIGSLRSEMIDTRKQLTNLAVNIEKAKNVGAYLALAVTFLSVVALFLGLR